MKLDLKAFVQDYFQLLSSVIKNDKMVFFHIKNTMHEA